MHSYGLEHIFFVILGLNILTQISGGPEEVGFEAPKHHQIGF